jgi:hypothetical protein
VSDLLVRRARDEDGPAVRRLITLGLLAAGFGVPDEEFDADLVDLAYYEGERRGLWVAVDPTGEVTGCAAIDQGEGDSAVLRRLSGRGLVDLTRAAIAFAQQHGYGAIETVLAPGLDEARDALVAMGFEQASEGNVLLYRRQL